MRIESYIEKLLYDYNCVVVPGFGAFLAHGKSAELDSVSNTLIPPSKTISFNAQLSKNDGLLVSLYRQGESILATKSLLEEVEKCCRKTGNKRLEQGESIELFGIGKLSMNREHKIQFQPENKINYLTSSFGLSAFAATPIQREVLKEEVEELEERIPFIITPEKTKRIFVQALVKICRCHFISRFS